MYTVCHSCCQCYPVVGVRKSQLGRKKPMRARSVASATWMPRSMAMAVGLLPLLVSVFFVACVVSGEVEASVALPGQKPWSSESGIRQVVAGAGEEHLVLSVGSTPDYMCQVCMELAAEAQQVLSDPDLEEAAASYVEGHACGRVPQPSLRKKCVGMVEEYMPNVFVALKNYAEPESLCVSSGFCGQKKTILRQKKDPNVCAICHDLASGALDFLQANRTTTDIVKALHQVCSKLEDFKQECDLLVDVYAPELIRRLSDTTPDEFCQQTRLCSEVYLLDAKDCQICQFVILELKLKLKDPALQDKLLDLLSKSCSKVPNHVEECKLIVQQYVPFILANLDTILDGNALCTRMGACP